MSHEIKETSKTKTKTVKAEGGPVLGPTLQIAGGMLNFIGAATGSVLVAGMLMSVSGLSIYIILGIAFALGAMLKVGGHYLTLKAQKRDKMFSVVDGLFGFDPAQRTAVAA